jgi:hypothetical protein
MDGGLPVIKRLSALALAAGVAGACTNAGSQVSPAFASASTLPSASTSAAGDPATGSAAVDSSAPVVGAQATVSGRLVLRGNEPVTYAVLETGTGLWELQGIPHETALRIQNHRITVTGRVARLQGGISNLPAIDVSHLTDVGTAP